MIQISDRAVQMEKLARQIRKCRRCPGMNIPKITEAAPGYGDPHSPVLLVGQSLCQPCMATQIPFTGGSGRLLDQAFSLAGIAKEQIFVTNVVHCHPPGNRPSLSQEIENCSEYLQAELAIVRPILIVGLGKDAHNAVKDWAGTKGISWSATLRKLKNEEPALLLMHHPAYVRRQSAAARSMYVHTLAEALKWAFSFTYKS